MGRGGAQRGVLYGHVLHATCLISCDMLHSHQKICCSKVHLNDPIAVRHAVFISLVYPRYGVGHSQPCPKLIVMTYVNDVDSIAK